jgi:hypothetical protein
LGDAAIALLRCADWRCAAYAAYAVDMALWLDFELTQPVICGERYARVQE